MLKQWLKNFYWNALSRNDAKKAEGIIFNDGEIGYFPFPKVACTSIKLEIFRLENGHDFNSSQGGVGIHSFYNERLEDISYCGIRMAVIRDPIKRLLSAYGNRVNHHKELSFKYLSQNNPDMIGTNIKFDPTLSEFVDNLSTYQRVHSILHHTRPMSSILSGNALDLFTHVYPLEQLSSLSKDLSEWTGTQSSFRRTQFRGSKHKVGELDVSQLEFLIDYYRKDYELVKDFYSPSNIRSEWESAKV
jgi:Sulfotransferase family